MEKKAFTIRLHSIQRNDVTRNKNPLVSHVELIHGSTLGTFTEHAPQLPNMGQYEPNMANERVVAIL